MLRSAGCTAKPTTRPEVMAGPSERSLKAATGRVGLGGVSFGWAASGAARTATRARLRSMVRLTGWVMGTVPRSLANLCLGLVAAGFSLRKTLPQAEACGYRKEW